MPDNNSTDNESINWIEEAISREFFKRYEYKYFTSIKEIGSGGFGKVYRANWKNSACLALKSFSNINNATAKEIVRELKLQRDVDFCKYIIRFYGITKFESENHDIKYMLVIEYADGGTLRNYLKNNINNLTWDDKFKLAYQLAFAVSCLHGEGIVHRDLHSSNVLIHQNTIKLADFGLSKRIEEASTLNSKFFGVIPYVDPKKFSKRKDSRDPAIIYELNKKSDVYSVGVLLWEISSYRPPFYTEGEHYDVGLALEISQGLRETVVPNTPENYVKVYTECWDSEPHNRPDINQVVDKLKVMLMRSIISKTNTITESFQLDNIGIPMDPEVNPNNNDSPHDSISSLHGEISQIIENFDKLNTKEIIGTLTLDLNIIINKLESFIFEKTNEGKESHLRKQQLLDNYKNNTQEIYKWLMYNQKESKHVFLLGYFNYLGIETIQNYEKAFYLFIDASKMNHILSHYFVGECYQFGYGITKNEKQAFIYFEKAAKKDYGIGQLKVGCCYDKGTGVKKNLKTAASWYEKAANNGNNTAIYNLAFMYIDGKGVKKDLQKAFQLFEQSAEKRDPDAISMLGYCYNNGMGTNMNKKKAFYSYQKAVELGNLSAQYNLALMYEAGEGIEKNIDKAIYWYKKSSEQGDKDAEYRLKILLEVKGDDEMILFNQNFHNFRNHNML